MMRFVLHATTVYRALPRLMQRRKMSSTADGAVLRESLCADESSIPNKYMYDLLGSKLFDVICHTPEYYLTRTEAAIFDRHSEELAAVAGTGVTLIEPGAGNCTKAARLIPYLRPRQYVPIDISTEFLEEGVGNLRTAFPALDVQPLAMDFTSALLLPPTVGPDSRLFFYPGSTLGSFEPTTAVEFLRTLRHNLQGGDGGGLLLGVDLVKDKAVIEEAYNDALGVTSAFCHNILLNVNRLIDADFDVSDWEHRAFFDPVLGRINLHLEAKRDLVVTWHDPPDGSRRFRTGERIRIGRSCKFTPDGISATLAQAGFSVANTWYDPRKWFTVLYAKPV